jgi:hypothetical protein
VTTRKARNKNYGTIDIAKSAVSALGDFSDRGISMTPQKRNLRNKVA